ncbi:hypothetical protein HanXRQr2_Chr16g0750431 [Helianthus annuus]|uniref:Uncharacterized protein n=1 Tax=Helianthus annuus TaxID=4232 RepID=A0A9K3DTE4_HELAN|nr:hypothetical protein HanXRQr2_Chr16g0750431 [Helianthus annuus]
MSARARARLDSSFVFKARARLVCIFSSSSLSSARARLVYYLLINILNKDNINNRLFRLMSSISEARTRARLLNKLIFRFEVGL